MEMRLDHDLDLGSFLPNAPIQPQLADFEIELLDSDSCPRPITGQTPPAPARRRSLWQQTQQAMVIRESQTFKGEYARRVGASRANLAKESPFNKLVRYYMKEGMHAKAQGQVLEALANLYEIMLSRPDHELIMRLGGYSPAVGHLIYAVFMHNPNNLLSWIAKQHSQTYAYRCFYTPKAIRKRTKVRQTVRCVHVPKEARLSQALRNLHFFTEDQKYNAIAERIFSALVETIFKYKKGTLYIRKLHAYRTAFNQAKQRQAS